MTAIARSISFGLALACLILSATLGCDKPFNFYGTWRGYRTISGQPGADPDILRQFGKVEVTVHDNERFEIAVNGLAATGSASHDGGTLVLTPQEVMGRPMNQQPESIRKIIPISTLKPNADGTVTYIAPGQDALVLERIATGTSNRP